MHFDLVPVLQKHQGKLQEKHHVTVSHKKIFFPVNVIPEQGTQAVCKNPK